MSHHQSVPGWQIAAAADIARRGAARNARQQAVDDVYQRANASEQHYVATGEITVFGQQAIIERDHLRAIGITPSWVIPPSGPVTNFAVGLLFLLVVTGGGWVLLLLVTAPFLHTSVVATALTPVFLLFWVRQMRGGGARTRKTPRADARPPGAVGWTGEPGGQTGYRERLP